MLKTLASLLLTLLVIATGCRKSDRQNDTDTQSSADYLQAHTFYANTATTVFDLLRGRPEIYLDADTANHQSGSCPSIVISPAYPDSTTYPKTITIDYGAANCTGADGLLRRGKLQVVINLNPLFNGSVITINPNSFYINDKEIRGGITLNRQANTASGHAVYSETVTNGEIHQSATAINYFRQEITRERVNGDTTLTISDDEYKFTGSASGYGIRGTNYSVTINTPYYSKPGCAYFDNGVATLKPGNLADRTIDLGSGCNAAANVKIFETVSEIGVQ